MTSLTFVNSNHRKYNNVLVFQPFRVFSTFYNFNLFKVTESKYISKLILSLYNPFGFNRDEKRILAMNLLKINFYSFIMVISVTLSWCQVEDIGDRINMSVESTRLKAH